MVTRLQSGNWTEFRQLPLSIEVNFHNSEGGQRNVSYDEAMGVVWNKALEAIIQAHRIGLKHVLFIHGFSTSRPGNTTARSQVRKLVRNKEVTPYIVRRSCIQHYSCLVVTIRENPTAKLPDLSCPQCKSREQKNKSRAGHFMCRSCRNVFNWFDL